jgi:hypothetical protein
MLENEGEIKLRFITKQQIESGVIELREPENEGHSSGLLGR